MISASLKPGDAVNIQFTSGTTGAPKGATLTHDNIVNNANFVTAAMNFGADDRLCIPVPLYHCFGMVMGTLGCVTKGATMVFPGEGFDPRATLKAVAAGALHRALRRADHVRRAARPSGFQELRPDLAQDRHHGRRAVPDRGDEAGRLGYAHVGGDDRLRHDRDQPGLLPERCRRSAGEARLDRRPHPSACRGQGHRRRRQDRAGRRARRALHARLFGDEGLLGRRRQDRRSDRRGRLDAHRRPRARSTPTATATSSAA